MMIISEILSRCNASIQVCKAKLEIEEANREVAKLQGELAGNKKLIQYISAAFEIDETAIKRLTYEPAIIPDLPQEEFDLLLLSAETVLEDDAWLDMVRRVDATTEELKSDLLFVAEKVRDLDVSQGVYRGMQEYSRTVKAIMDDHERRQKKAAEERREPALPFGEE